jgi:four helix bundle protein
LNFLSIANGSLKEVETQATIAQRLQFIRQETQSEILEKTTEIGRLLSGLTNALKKRLD